MKQSTYSYLIAFTYFISVIMIYLLFSVFTDSEGAIRLTYMFSVFIFVAKVREYFKEEKENASPRQLVYLLSNKHSNKIQIRFK